MMRPGRILHVHVSSRAHISKGSVAYRFSLQERRIGELGREMTWARDRAREAGGGGIEKSIFDFFPRAITRPHHFSPQLSNPPVLQANIDFAHKKRQLYVWVSREKRKIDVSCGQNRYVKLPTTVFDFTRPLGVFHQKKIVFRLPSIIDSIYGNS